MNNIYGLSVRRVKRIARIFLISAIGIKRWRKSMDKKVKMEMFEKLERLENRKQKIMEQAIMHDGGMNPFSEDICNALDSQIIDIEIQLEENGIVYPYV